MGIGIVLRDTLRFSLTPESCRIGVIPESKIPSIVVMRISKQNRRWVALVGGVVLRKICHQTIHHNKRTQTSNKAIENRRRQGEVLILLCVVPCSARVFPEKLRYRSCQADVHNFKTKCQSGQSKCVHSYLSFPVHIFEKFRCQGRCQGTKISYGGTGTYASRCIQRVYLHDGYEIRIPSVMTPPLLQTTIH